MKKYNPKQVRKGKDGNAELLGVVESVDLGEEFKGTPQEVSKLKQLQKAYGGINKIDPSSPTYKKMEALIDSMSKDQLKGLAFAKIKFLSMLAATKLRYKHDIKLPFGDYWAESVDHTLESVDHLEEGKMKDFHDMVKKGMSAEQIAKKIGFPVKDVKDFMKGMNESVELDEKKSLNKDGDIEMTKAEYRKTHKDFKGKWPDGTSYVSYNGGGKGTQLVSVKFVKESVDLEEEKDEYRNIGKTIAQTPKHKRDKKATDAQPAKTDPKAVARRKAIEKHQERRRAKKDSYWDESVSEALKMTDSKLTDIFDKLKKGSTVKIKSDSSIAKGDDFIEYKVVSKNLVQKGKPNEQEKITLASLSNPNAVKKFLYKRSNGSVTMAHGNMGVSIVDIKEAKKDSAADLYFDTYTSAVQHAKSQAEKKGFEVVEDDWFTQVTTGRGKPSSGKSVRHTLKLTKNDKAVRQGLSIQVYNRDTNRNTYELNYYIS